MGESNRGIALPSRVVVSLRAGFFLAIANVLCALILAGAWTRSHAQPKTITVTGSARKELRSDLIVWQATFSADQPDLPGAYRSLQDSADKTTAFLKSAGVPADQIELSSITVTKHFEHGPGGHVTDKISGYELSQSAQVTSADVSRIAGLSRSITALIKDGVLIVSEPPRYLYTKLAGLKITMLAEATKDAAERARQIAANSSANLGPIVDAHMGVMQINPIHSNAVSDEGNNDDTSLDKEITAVVTARFEVR